jgi:hypothetical protein
MRGSGGTLGSDNFFKRIRQSLIVMRWRKQGMYVEQPAFTNSIEGVEKVHANYSLNGRTVISLAML